MGVMLLPQRKVLYFYKALCEAMSEERFTNRLIKEKSPYLLQHAHNPVDWYPWGEEAFEFAKKNDRPIFLSIGYATCHWCHVMEKECFQNIAIAMQMNKSFVNIKVDREELPEVDSLYMEFAQAIIPGGGGWPLNILLTPDLKPFFATTYLPAQSGKGFMGLSELIQKLTELWMDAEEREKLIEQAAHLIEVFDNLDDYKGDQLPYREVLGETADLLFQMADPIYGGIKGEPKFPMGYHSCFLLRFAKAASDSRALFYVELTLDMMHRGAIYDHLGGGVSRYSVDDRWLIPHFEKMLYDSAILARAYLEAWLYTKKSFYKETCEEIIQYILRDMSHPGGGFYSAEDADSDGKEGFFYTWTLQEVEAALDADAALFCEFYGIHPHGPFEGRCALHMPESMEEFAARKHLDIVFLKDHLDKMRKQLLEARSARPRPKKDDKILVSWNALAMYVLVMAGKAFNKKDYIAIAQKAAVFIKNNLWQEGHLLRRWRAGEARFFSGLDEYAFMIQALLSFFEEDGSLQWLSWAMEMTEILEKEFKIEGGAFYFTDGKDPHIVLRRCEFFDGSEPSGNGVHCENLLRLYQITANEHYLHQAEDILKAVKRHIEHHPIGCCYHLIALQRYYDKNASTIVVALNEREEYKSEIRELLFTHFNIHNTVIWRRFNDRQMSKVINYLETYVPINDQTTVYICQKGQCKHPLSEWSQIVMALTHL